MLLAGPPGVGKRAAARWIAASNAGHGDNGACPCIRARFPSTLICTGWHRLEDKETIGIDQIRELVNAMSLTSYEGGSKVAVIEPANAMTINAANSLLKTLEEPPGDALLILVADRVGKLPATIFSRCQRIDFAPPAESRGPGVARSAAARHAWSEALRAAGGAPLARDRRTGGPRDRCGEWRATCNALGRGSGSAVEVAARWTKIEPGFVLNWLAQQVKLAVFASSAGREHAAGLAIDDSVLRRMDRRNLFCYLDIINRLRGQPGGSYNVQLTFESLLIDWAGGLQDCGQDTPTDGMNLMLAGQ